MGIGNSCAMEINKHFTSCSATSPITNLLLPLPPRLPPFGVKVLRRGPLRHRNPMLIIITITIHITDLMESTQGLQASVIPASLYHLGSRSQA